MTYPFVYISSLIRSGSTLIQELLTSPPHSFIFHEPELLNNKFITNKKHLKLFLDHGIDINNIMKNGGLSKFKKDVLPLLQKHVKQIGVKEVRNTNWKRYVDNFSNIRIVLTGRDPRDLYISIFYWKNKSGKLNKLSKKTINNLKNQMNIQQEIFNNGNVIKVKYEELCTNQNLIISEIKRFIDSPISEVGEIGGFLSNVPRRINEYNKHGNIITKRSVARWKKDKNKRLIQLSNDFFESVPDYCNFWGYERR